MQCPRCHTENRSGRRFCAECAAPLAAPCPACGFTNEPGEKFCGGCAAPLTAESRQAEPRFAAPDAYTPKHLAERILTSKAALEGERKQVTVLFADLKGSMELLADRDPEEARTLLDPVLERMMEAVHRYEGTVNQVMGDGIMALFGAPLAHEDHAVRACYAALRMQESVKRYAEGVRREHGITVRIRVGLNSGEVVVRAIGSDLHMDYTAVGQTTHLAARMEQLADPGAILLTPQTLALAEGFVQILSLGPMAVRGLSAPVEVYELTGVSAVRSRLLATAARGLTRFVGRDAEVEQLRRTLEQARQGRGQVAALVGEPGVGKSRLVFELTHSHRVEGWLVLEASSVSYGKATSYLPVIELLKSYFRIDTRDTYREIREKVTGKLLTLDRTLEPSLPALLALLDVPVEDPQWPVLEPPQRRQRTLAAVKWLLLREAQSQPLLVIFEDLHWIDSETQALLDSLVDSLPTARVLLLVTYRPEYQHPWGSKTFYTQLRLDTLPLKTAGQMLNTLLGSDASLTLLKMLLATKTGGNPLFLEESVRTLVETGALLGERGVYQLAQPVGAIHVPATVQAILASRIDRLLPEEKRLLEIAAVIGKDVPFPLLQAIADESEETLRGGLSRLRSAEFLYETTLFPDLEYTFKHALTHEVAYSTVLHDRRRHLHTQITHSIERLYPERLQEHVEQLAHHAFRGELWETAIVYLRQAAAKAMTRSAHREAATYLKQTLDVLAHVPQTREYLAEGIDVRFALRYALSPLGDWAQALDYVEEAGRLAEALGDQRRLGWAQANIVAPLSLRGDHTRAVEVGERALAIAKNVEDVGLQRETEFYVALAHGNLGNYDQAIMLLREIIAAMVGEWKYWGTPGISSVLSGAYLAVYLSRLGQFPEAIHHSDAALRIAEEAAKPYSQIFAYVGAAQVYLNQGDTSKAIPLLEQSLQLGVSWDIPALRPWATASLSLALGRIGRVTEAMSLAAELGSLAYLPSGRASPPLLWLSEIYFTTGRVADALPLADHALSLSRECHEQGHEAQALHLQGELAAHREPVDVERARHFYLQALALAEPRGMRPLVAHCHLGLGQLYRRTGDGAKAQEHLTTAATMYREMDMSFWLPQAETHLSESS